MFTGRSTAHSHYRSGSHYRMPWLQRLGRMAFSVTQAALLMLLAYFAYRGLLTESWQLPALLFSLVGVLAVITYWPDLKDL
jgi:hypothetical protein